jgi:ABC-2 type transport system ATP-binding protein
MNLIESEKLTYRYRRTDAVSRMDLVIPEGSVYALLGPNGAGKTTTIKLIMNLLSPSSGSVRVLGVDSRQLGPSQLAQIGYVSENQQLPLWMTVAGLIDYCRPLYPTWDKALEARLLNQFELPPDRKLKHLSRGMLMKAALIVSLAYRPKLLVLDEPFSGLDPLARDEFARGLSAASAAGDWTILVSTHDIEEVERLCDWVGMIEAGRLRSAEATDSLLGRYRRVEVVTSGPLPTDPFLAPAAWIDWEHASGLIRFADSGYAGESSEASYRALYPGGAVAVRPMTLREIFLAQSRTARTVRKGAAA